VPCSHLSRLQWWAACVVVCRQQYGKLDLLPFKMAGELNVSKLNISFGSINVNSMNVSTLGNKNAKSYIKVEGVTAFKHDILFLSDLRLKDRENEVKRLMGLNKNESYRLYANSSREARGVGVAIKRKIAHDIIEIYCTEDQNLILLKVRIKGILCVIGAVYGPNENNSGFYRQLKNKIREWDLPYVIGGDFNTILDQTVGDFNLDRIGGGRIPNVRNGLEIINWIEEGNCFDPFRSLYPEQQEISYIPFRLIREGGDP